MDRNERAKKVLRYLGGFLDGILADGHVDQCELDRLQDWLTDNEDLIMEKPFSDIIWAVQDFLNKGEFEIEEVLDLQTIVGARLDFIAEMTKDKDTLPVFIGLCKGVLADRRVSMAEIVEIEKWIRTNNLDHRRPFSEIYDIVSRALSDGKITELERNEISNILKRYAVIE